MRDFASRQDGTRRLPYTIACAVILAGIAAPRAGAEAPVGDASALRTEEAAVAPGSLAPQQLAARIDADLRAAREAAGVAPAPPASDAEFLRRASLGIVGKIPTVAEARAFLDDPSPDKRARLVEDLLGRASCAAHFANTWRELILPGANSNPETRGLVPPFEGWLRLRFAANTPYNELAAEVLTAVQQPAAMAVTPFAVNNDAPLSPLAFYQVNEQKPENLAANTARVFLGLQVQCAQCHDHPFADWKQTQFWQLAAFFGNAAGDAAAGAMPSDDPSQRTITIPDLDVVVEACFLDGSQPAWRAGEGRRTALARWITRPENPFFARAAVNRVWEMFFGHGFVEPVDDLDPANRASHAELFEEIAAQFVLHDYDLKYLVRTIAATEAYQFSSRTKEVGETDPRLFARLPLRQMTPEQLFDSLVQATGYRERIAEEQLFNPFAEDSIRAQFQARFRQAQRRTEAETSILQALALMNGSFVADATSLQQSETLAAVAEMPLVDTETRVETLFLATLTRQPTPEEAAEFAAYVDSGGSTGDTRAALADVFWALLNSAEFVLDH